MRIHLEWHSLSGPLDSSGEINPLSGWGDLTPAFADSRRDRLPSFESSRPAAGGAMRVHC